MASLRQRYGHAAGGAAQVGQKVTVNLGRRGGVQSGTVTRVFSDGRFEWKNRNNYERISKPSELTREPERAGQPDDYVAAWLAEEDE